MPVTSATLLTAIREDLVAAGLVRKPDAAGDLPPMHVEPETPPAPGDTLDAKDPTATRRTAGDLVVTIRLGSEIARPPLDTYARTYAVDVIYRSAHGNRALIAGRVLDEAIHARLLRAGSHGLGILLAAGTPAQLSAIAVEQYAGIGPVGVVGGIRTERASLAFTVPVA